jgi:hypothetical protein
MTPWGLRVSIVGARVDSLDGQWASTPYAKCRPEINSCKSKVLPLLFGDGTSFDATNVLILCAFCLDVRLMLKTAAQKCQMSWQSDVVSTELSI